MPSIRQRAENPDAEWPVHPNVPADKPENWAHSDFKDVAIQYVQILATNSNVRAKTELLATTKRQRAAFEDPSRAEEIAEYWQPTATAVPSYLSGHHGMKFQRFDFGFPLRTYRMDERIRLMVGTGKATAYDQNRNQYWQPTAMSVPSCLGN